MRISAISIFPDYFAPLELSLIGKSRDAGLISFDIHDLRAFTSDPHKTVDDTPYGGGAGMVMKPEPWGDAIDAISSQAEHIVDLIILTPAGKTFTQKMAHDFQSANHLLFACGRYEGIDNRVSEYYRLQPKFRVHEISIGDYVLGGGEVAALVIIEAIVRLLPGVVGNPESLLAESHTEGGMVEYPSYTKPPSWRGLNVPEILTSGNHGAIAQWRVKESQKRTQERER